MHLGPYPLELLARSSEPPDLSAVPASEPLSFDHSQRPVSIVNAMRDYQAMIDAIRIGLVSPVVSEVPEDPAERAEHLKAFAYFADASMAAVCELPDAARLAEPHHNPDIEPLAQRLLHTQTKTLAAGIDVIMADLKESIEAPPTDIASHSHALAVLYEYPRDPAPEEPGSEWILDAQAQRASLLASETAVVLANYLRVLGFEARAHTACSADVDLNKVTVACGLATAEGGRLVNPYVGSDFGVAVVTTTMRLAADDPLVALADQPRRATHGLRWRLGVGFAKSGRAGKRYRKRRFVDGEYPFEKLKRVDSPTTFIDDERVARVPKRADMFARAQFGDMGPKNQEAATNGYFAMKAAPARAQRRLLGAFVLLQNEPAAAVPQALAEATADPARNAENVKAASYFLGMDAVGASACPAWAWYSHDATGEEIDPPHDQAVSMIVDQGYETMEGASGDDWISVSQSMRAYLRFATLGGVIAKHLRNLGHEAKAHTNIDGEVLQPPLLLLSGLGEVSRIGEVILNPYLGPRLKSGVVTTTMPLRHDKPIDFGLQSFCEQCNKCARECPAGAITAGPKLMFNGYEIYKSDSQKCLTYRLTTPGGAMCGRCMKTCPWNLEGLFAEAPFRWAAMKIPRAAKLLAALDDKAGNGGLNPVKKWWWDLKLDTADDAYRPVPVELVNKRDLQTDLEVRYEDQTLAVYPAPLAPPPWPFPFPADRERGIEAYQAMVTAREYQAAIAEGRAGDVVHEYTIETKAPVVRVRIARTQAMTEAISKYELVSLDGSELPAWTAGSHLDIVVAPGLLRQYSLCGDPADRSRYEIGVLREDAGRGGSQLLHRIFSQGRKIFVSEPINHFPLQRTAQRSYLMAGGIGVTPMIAMAHEAHAAGLDFELHYSISSRSAAGFLDDLDGVAWSDRVRLHVSDEGTRCDLAEVLSGGSVGAGNGVGVDPASGSAHVYACGPGRYMDAVMQAAESLGYPPESCHLEYFSVPELPEYECHDFTLRLARSGRQVKVPADLNATDALAAVGIHVDVKCSDGICGVCKVDLLEGEVDHRDFVLSNAQRRSAMILCQSRAAEPDGEVLVDL